MLDSIQIVSKKQDAHTIVTIKEAYKQFVKTNFQ